MTRLTLAALGVLLAAGAATAAAPRAAAPSTLVEFCVTPDGVCPLPRPAAPGTACSCRWPKGNVSAGQAGE